MTRSQSRSRFSTWCSTLESLPCLVDSATWIPVRVATRWAVRYRRYRVQASTLANNLRVLARVYLWAREYAGYDLDNHLTQGQTLRNREIESLVCTLRVKLDRHALDTRAARQLIHARVQDSRSRVSYWLDLGSTADTGQFILGQPLNGRNRRSALRFRTAGELFPEIINPYFDDAAAPSCSALVALERQEPFVNQSLAYQALALLTRLLLFGRLEHHGAFVNVAASRVQAVMIDARRWQSLRRRGVRKLLNGRPENSRSMP